MKIAIIGQGNVGTNLLHAFEMKNIRAAFIDSHDAGQLASLSGVEWQNSVLIYAVADHALRQVVEQVNAPKALHLHTSGTMPIDVFGDDKPHAGIIYFFQSFTKAALIDDWSTIPVIIEGKNIDDVAAIYTLALTLTPRVIEASQADRERLHVAGVFANNFTNCMYRIAADLLKGTSIPFSALLPLIDQTAAKVHTLAPKDAQTGPAVRDDQQVINHHLDLLAQLTKQTGDRPQEIYRLLTEYIQQ